MSIHNSDIAAAFDEIADLLALADANPFRIRAYRKAARTVAECALDLPELVAQAAPLPRLPGIGKDLAAKIAEISHKGSCELLLSLRREQRPAPALLAIPGLGPRRIRTLTDARGIRTPAQLLAAARQGELRGLPGFGARLEQRLLDAVTRRMPRNRRFPRAQVAPVVAKLLAYLRSVPGVTNADIAGSYRRGRETVGDLDIVVTGARGHMAGFALTVFDDVEDVLAQGLRRVSVLLRGGLQVDLCIVNASAYGAAMMYFTGSREHGIALRRLARQRNFRLNEYGLFDGTKRIAGATENDVYRHLGLPFIEPELREDRGEIASAQNDLLPRLVQSADLCGALHVHDGEDFDIQAEVDAARRRGLRYLAVCHSFARAGTMASADAEWRHFRTAIDAGMRGVASSTLLRGVEVGIRRDGSLDVSSEILSRAEIVIAAIHSDFDVPPAEQIQRLRCALENPFVDVLGLPDVRSFGSVDAAMAALRALAPRISARGIALELSARADLPDAIDRCCRVARDLAIPMIATSRSRGRRAFDELDGAVVQARRGWLEPHDLINHMPMAVFRRWLWRRRAAVDPVHPGKSIAVPARRGESSIARHPR